MTDPELTPDQIEDMLDRYAKQHRGDEIDPERLRAVLEHVWEYVTSEHYPLHVKVRELHELGASLFLVPVDAAGKVEVRLGFLKGPERPKSGGRSVPLGKFELAEIQSLPRG
jgi:hypothetical protein